MAINIGICNLALGELFEKPIADIDEGSNAADLCQRFYPHCLSVLLERFEWSFANRTQPLALLATNPRASEWAYAYAVPSDMATAIRLAPPQDGSTAVYSWLYDWPAPPQWWQSFIVADGVIYTQIANAVLEYSASTIADAAMPAMFRDGLYKTLAAHLVVPLRNDRAMKQSLLQEAEVSIQRAIADDRNRQPQRDQQSFNEVGYVRNGSYGGITGWDR